MVSVMGSAAARCQPLNGGSSTIRTASVRRSSEIQRLPSPKRPSTYSRSSPTVAGIESGGGPSTSPTRRYSRQ